MGKVKVRTLGGEAEEKEKKDQKKKAEEKKILRSGKGDRVAQVGPSEEEIEKLEEHTTEEKVKASSEAGSGSARKKEKFAKAKHKRSKKYDELRGSTEKTPLPVSQALSLLEKLQRKTFDETVELHLNSKDPKISAQTSLPHGTGKTLKVAVASDALIEQVEKGKVDFDILLSHPSMMPKLAKVAKILGPKGLMPNPKNGTITNNPEEAAKKYEGGLTFIKTESKVPIIHIAVGKVSFGPKKLEENIEAVIAAVKKENIEKAVLKSTMSPAIKLSL